MYLKPLHSNSFLYGFIKARQKGNQNREREKVQLGKFEPTQAKRPHPVSAEMSIANRPGLDVRQKAKILEKFENVANVDATEEDTSNDAAIEDRYLTLEEMNDNVEGGDGEDNLGRGLDEGKVGRWLERRV